MENLFLFDILWPLAVAVLGGIDSRKGLGQTDIACDATCQAGREAQT